jgi:hypothetical protein
VRRTWLLALVAVPAPLALLGLAASDSTNGISVAATMLATGVAALQLTRQAQLAPRRSFALVAASLAAYYAWLLPMLALLVALAWAL